MEQHYADRIYLDQICRCAGLSKSTLPRAFTRSKGVTPYGYLENIRIGKAKKLLEQGVPPVEAALRTGFSDQSHFTRYWGRLIGLAPGVYQDIFKYAEGRPKENSPAAGRLSAPSAAEMDAGGPAPDREKYMFKERGKRK